jgi:molybdopterin-binding protein
MAMDTQASSGTSKLLVLIVGIVIGLLVAATIALVKIGLDSRNDQPQVTTETAGILLSIDSPSEGDITSDEKIVIKGTTGKDAVIAITGGVDDAINETKSGKFSIEIKLSEGENEISVYAFDTSSGESAQDTIRLLFLKANLAAEKTLVASSHKTLAEKDTDNINKLKKDLATKSSEKKSSGAIYKRSHVFGTITDIKNQTLTIETKKGSIKTVFTDEFTEFYSVGAKGKSSVSLEELKVGDRISVVGIGKDDTDGSAKFIVRQSKSISKRHALLGKIKKISGNTLTLTHITQTGREFTILVNKEVVIKLKGVEGDSAIEDLKKGDVIVATGNINKKGSLVANKIFVVPGKREGLKPKESTKSATPSSDQ